MTILAASLAFALLVRHAWTGEWMRRPAFCLMLLVLLGSIISYHPPIVAHAGPMTEGEREPWARIAMASAVARGLWMVESTWKVIDACDPVVGLHVAIMTLLGGAVGAWMMANLGEYYGRSVWLDATMTGALFMASLMAGMIGWAKGLKVGWGYGLMIAMLAIPPLADVSMWFWKPGSLESKMLNLISQNVICVCLAVWLTSNHKHQHEHQGAKRKRYGKIPDDGVSHCVPVTL